MAPVGLAARAQVSALPGVPRPQGPSWDPLTPQAQKGESQQFCYMTPPERAEETNPAEPHKLLDSVLQHRAN